MMCFCLVWFVVECCEQVIFDGWFQFKQRLVYRFLKFVFVVYFIDECLFVDNVVILFEYFELVDWFVGLCEIYYFCEW